MTEPTKQAEPLGVVARQARDLESGRKAIRKMIEAGGPGLEEGAQHIADVISFISTESEARVATICALQAEIEYLKGSREHYTEMCEVYKAENARRRGLLDISEWDGADSVEQRDRLREALEKYGRHMPDCAPLGDCTCGLDAAKGKEPHE